MGEVNKPLKHIRGSIASYIHEDGQSLCDTDEMAEKLLHVFELPFTSRIPFAVCSELQIFAKAYLFYKDRCPKEKLPKPRKKKTLAEVEG